MLADHDHNFPLGRLVHPGNARAGRVMPFDSLRCNCRLRGLDRDQCDIDRAVVLVVRTIGGIDDRR